MQIVMFTVGSVIFILYMLGLLTMINRSHKEQEKILKIYPIMRMKWIWTGMGNFSRFPNDKKKVKYTKK